MGILPPEGSYSFTLFLFHIGQIANMQLQVKGITFDWSKERCLVDFCKILFDLLSTRRKNYSEHRTIEQFVLVVDIYCMYLKWIIYKQ